ncbi:hypothetical protein T4B_11753 [Trichinella pseudospiralis]|uniref:Uncharacterized protein n=2 Tax=Trichinella pseudospiralis TaxID=6337 RepID=A0A0V1FXA7_TRIPS|nr:hypothetical protein T4D_2541 [Trichinella pseudospiralis]KRZ29391.1 hypothetical protein T4B_11753 [Trichinella pseudospiralis]
MDKPKQTSSSSTVNYIVSVCDFVLVVVDDWKPSTPNTGVVVRVVLVEWIVQLAYGCGNTAPVSAAANSSHPPVHWCPLG